MDNSWVEVALTSKFGDYVHGGSLDKINEGWKQVNFKYPDGEICARDSFGYACYNNEVTIIGGKTTHGTTNSMFMIEIDKLTGKNELSEI